MWLYYLKTSERFSEVLIKYFIFILISFFNPKIVKFLEDFLYFISLHSFGVFVLLQSDYVDLFYCPVSIESAVFQQKRNNVRNERNQTPDNIYDNILY